MGKTVGNLAGERPWYPIAVVTAFLSATLTLPHLKMPMSSKNTLSFLAVQWLRPVLPLQGRFDPCLGSFMPGDAAKKKKKI